MKMVAFGYLRYIGKSTACRFLCSELRTMKKGSRIIQVGFADKLKDIIFQLYSWAGVKPKEYYEEFPLEKDEPIKALGGKSYRDLCIELGNKTREFVYRYTWIDYLFHHHKAADVLLISDMRFCDEADRIKSLGGHVFKIDRKEVEHLNDGRDYDLNNYNNWDRIIDNNGELSNFHKQISTLIKDFDL